MSRADDERLRRIHELPCVVCELMGLGNLVCGPTEAHHIVDSGYRRLSGGHQSTIPLGRYHHRGVPLDGYSQTAMEVTYGPSLALSKRAFIARYGTERELLAAVDREIRRIFSDGETMQKG